MAKSGLTLLDWIEVARNLIMQGRPQEAEAFLSAIPRLGPLPGRPPQETLIAYERVRARLEVSDFAGALQLLPKDDPEDRFLQVRGEVLCAARDRSAGLAH